jgi:hypothetical protein
MTDREALKIAFNALKSIDAEAPYPIAKHAIKCINAAFSTEHEKRPDYCGSGHCSCIECPFGMDQEPIGYADKYDLEREGHDFWISRQQGKNTVPIYKGKNGD